MRISVPIILYFIAHFSFGQLTIKPIVQQTKSVQARVAKTQLTTPSKLPFWDDFSITTNSPDSIRIWGSDTASQWNYELSKNVFVNATLAINPPSYKVATLDGLDANGAFHGAEKGLTDELVSDTINLAGKANVVFSFYWQAGGNVEIPEEGDSLVLQFHNPNAEGEKWITQWLVDGKEIVNGEDSVFTQKTITIPSQYLTQKFLFRFRSYGDQDGPFDAWHLDWIYLNDNRTNDDFYYLDRGLTGQLTSPLAPFKSVPTHQFQSNVSDLSSSQIVQAFNLDKQIQPTEYILVINNGNNGDRIDSVEYGTKDPLLNNESPFRVTNQRYITLDELDLTTIPTQDSLTIISEVYLEDSDDDFLDGSNVNLKINDTIRTQYLLHNYYAYDDGSAEYAVGTNINGGQVGVKFWLEQTDTLTHVDIHFPNIAPASTGKPLKLKIFGRLDQDPLREESISVINGQQINEFARYKLSKPIILSDTFFIAYQQSINEYIGVGFDRSNPEAAKYIYENRKGKWEQNNRLKGAIMMRPVFDTADSLVTALSDSPTASSFPYPNPTKGSLKITGTYIAITITDFSGKKCLHETSKPLHDVSDLPSGLYLLTIHRKEGDQTVKIIKK